jgi:hypothetical protein
MYKLILINEDDMSRAVMPLAKKSLEFVLPEEAAEWIKSLFIASNIEIGYTYQIKHGVTNSSVHNNSNTFADDAFVKSKEAARHKDGLKDCGCPDCIEQRQRHCKHAKTEWFEDGAMYRCLTCGATGITGKELG